MRKLYDYLKKRRRPKISEDKLADILRAELVNSVSAMDRFLHEIVRVGVRNSYLSTSTQTSKCQTIPFKFSTLNKIIECERKRKPPRYQEETAIYWIDKEIVEILRSMSFQKINKIKDALSYIWDVQHKMPAIISKMRYVFPVVTDNEKQKFLEEKIDLIVSRRNQIVHEADYDVAIRSKQTIDTDWLDDTISFIKEFTYSIYENVTGDTSYARI
jgi:hypothetical protein